MVCTPGVFISRFWNGGAGKCALISGFPLSSMLMPSGWDRATVSLSRRAYSARPNSLAAAICRMIAGIETLIADSAMRSLSVKSRIDFTLGSAVLSQLDWLTRDEIPLISLDEPLVRDQTVRKPGGPLVTMLTLPDISASLTAA